MNWMNMPREPATFESVWVQFTAQPTHHSFATDRDQQRDPLPNQWRPRSVFEFFCRECGAEPFQSCHEWGHEVACHPTRWRAVRAAGKVRRRRVRFRREFRSD